MVVHEVHPTPKHGLRIVHNRKKNKKGNHLLRVIAFFIFLNVQTYPNIQEPLRKSVPLFIRYNSPPVVERIDNDLS